MSRCVAGFAALLTLCSGTLFAGDEVLLRYKLGKDDKLIYRTDVSQSMTQSVAGAKQEMEMKQEGICVRTLDKIDEQGNFRFRDEEKYLKVYLLLDPAGEYNFDSSSDKRDKDSPLTESLNPLFELMKGEVSQLTLSPAGRFVSVDRNRKQIEAVVKNNDFAAHFAGPTTELEAKYVAEELFPVFPDKPVKPGDTWEWKFDYRLPTYGHVVGKRTHKFEACDKFGERRTARIRTSSELTIEFERMENGVKTSGKMQSDVSTGVIQFDVERGLLVLMEHSYIIGGSTAYEVAGSKFPAEISESYTIRTEMLDKLPENLTPSK